MQCSLLLELHAQWNFWQAQRIFKDPMATAAAIDRLVHHAVILEFNLPSYRTRKRRRTEATDAADATPG